MKQLILAAVLAVTGVMAQTNRHAVQQIPDADVAKMKEAIAAQTLPSQPQKANILVFWRCEGFAHGKAIDHANLMFKLLAEKGVWNVKFSDDYADLAPASLAKYDVLVMNNTTGLNLGKHPELEADIISFVESGKGYVVLHGGADNFGKSEKLCALAGGLFGGHPWGGGGKWKFKVDAANSPINASLGKESFFWGDEIYQHKPPYGDRAKMNVLVSLDFSDPATAAAGTKDKDKKTGQIVNKQNHQDTNDYPVSWTREQGKGRVFYTSFGHDQRAYLDAKISEHIMRGVLFAAGSLK